MNGLSKIDMSLENIYEDLKSKFPTNIIYLFEEYIFIEYKSKENRINFEIYDYNKILATCGETDYTDKLTKLFQECTDLPKHQIPANMIDIFIAEEFDDYIGEEFKYENMGNKTDLYKELQSYKNVKNKIIFFSFGERKYDPVKVEQNKIVDKLRISYKCDKTFDARKANAHRGPGHRGTEEILQKCMEAGSGYDKLMTDIVTHIDTYDSKVIGIYCSEGHHRSVALVELLKKYVYKNAIIKHLHIK
jgi:hypothetical protein